MTPLLRRRALTLGLLTVLGLTGCASERYKAQARKEKADKDNYVDYYSVGSNIPIRIPKDQAKASEAETARTQEVFRDVQRAGVKTPGESAGGGGR